MKKLLIKLFLFTLISIPGLFGNIENVYGQPSLHDSLRHMLTYFGENTKDDKILKAIKGAKTLYTSDAIDDSLSKILLIVDSLLVNDWQSDQQMVLSCATTLVQLFHHLPGGYGHHNYASSLNNLAVLCIAMGHYDKAFSFYEQALAVRKKTSGEKHPEYATILKNLANLHLFMGKHDKAQPLYEQALAIRKSTLVP